MRKGLGQEDIMHKNFATIVRKYACYQQLKNVISWTYMPSGEARTKTTGSLLKSKGMARGYADFYFRKKDENNICHNIWIEFKTETGKQSETQKEFEKDCTCENEHYYLARSVKEGVEILINEGLLNN